MHPFATAFALPAGAGVPGDPAGGAMAPAVPGYRIERLLARGRSARVWLARSAGGGCVALKLANRGTEGSGHAERLAREYALLARLRDRRVVRVHGHGATARLAWLAMEYIGGGALRGALHGAVAPAAAVHFIREAARALAAVHAAGIVHRDLKPENLLLRGDGSLVLADFGAGAPRANEHWRVAPGTLTGTARYAAPEQLEGAPPTPCADVYSLGVMLYELLAGRPPFAGATTLETIAQHLAAPVPRLAGALAAWQGVVDRLLEKRPSHRPRDAAMALREIDALAPRVAASTEESE